MRNIFITGIGGVFWISAGLLAACGSGAVQTETAKILDASVVTAADDSAANTSLPVITDSAKAFTVDFKSKPAQIEAGKPVMLFFTVKDRTGGLVKDLRVVHEKPMHLLAASKDLAEFYHIHPEQQADGSYCVSHTFPNGGDYKLYADFTPKEATQVVERIDVKVAGAERAKVALVPDQKLEKAVDGLRVVIKPSREIKAGQELTLDFQAFDAKTYKPAADLQNYLGELAHFVIISEDLKDFVHAHPMAKGEKMDGMKVDGQKTGDHSAGGHDHSDGEGAGVKPSQSEVSAHTAFPRAGLYKLWAQFKRGGRVINVPFIVRVPEGDRARTANNDSIPADAAKVTVSKNGYEPSEIKVAKGKPVKIVFYRADAENCGGEVIFSKLNVTRKLPVGETVLIEFTPQEAGEIGFACGMGMMKGKVLVQ